MSVRHLVNIIGLLLVFVSIAMAATGLGALFYEDGAAFALFASSGITFLAGLGAYGVTKFEGELTAREGYAIVTLAWTAMAVFGALPFLISGTLDSVIPAIFEAMSGFTTTGAATWRRCRKASSCGARSHTGWVEWGSSCSPSPSCHMWA